MRNLHVTIQALLVLLVGSHACQAGGPLYFGNAPIVWDITAPIKYSIDKGKLGPISEADIQGAIKDAFQAWTDVSTAAITFKFDKVLDDDVETLADYQVATENETGGNVVILDDNGDIVAEIYGEANRSRILGFAAPVVNGNKITAFYSLMNGNLAVNRTTFLSTLIHEFGHAVGLDHSQIHADMAGDGNAANDKYIPTMFPTSSDDDTLLGTLNEDDIAWISYLYPSPTFVTTYGLIKGRLVRPGSAATPVKGANVIAIRTGMGVTAEESRMLRCSCVCDWLTKGTGEFVIPVRKGTYRLHIEPIRSDFTGGSSVGPYSEKATSASFVNPVDESDPQATATVNAGNSQDLGTIVAD